MLRPTLIHRTPAGQWLVGVVILFVAAGCKQRTTVCENPSYFRRMALAPEAPAGSFAAAAPGPAVAAEEILLRPEYVVFRDRKHVTIGFMSYGHTSSYADFVFHPDAGEARSEARPAVTYAMARISDGHRQRVRVGFRSSLCTEEEFKASLCSQHRGGEVDLLAEMACQDVAAR